MNMKNHFFTVTTYIFKDPAKAAKFAADHHAYFYKTGERYTVTIYN